MMRCGTRGRIGRLVAAVVACGLAGACAPCAREQYLTSQRTTVRAEAVTDQAASGSLATRIAASDSELRAAIEP